MLLMIIGCNAYVSGIELFDICSHSFQLHEDLIHCPPKEDIRYIDCDLKSITGSFIKWWDLIIIVMFEALCAPY